MTAGGRRVALVISRVQDYQLPLVLGAQEVLEQAGVALLVVVDHPSDPPGASLLPLLVASGSVQGVIATSMADPSTGRSRTADVVAALPEVPVVTLSVQVAGSPVVSCDNEGSVRAVLAHLVHDLGRSRLVMVTGATGNHDAQERESSFAAVAAQMGVTLPAQPLVMGGFDREIAYRAMRERLRGGRDFDAVVAANDAMALGVLDALGDHDVRVPDDVALVGFDDSPAARTTDPPLSSVDQQLQVQARTAAEVLLARMAGRPVPDRVRVRGELVVRASTAGPASPARPGRQPDDAQQPQDPALRLRMLRPAGTAVGTDVPQRLEALREAWLPSLLSGDADPGARAALSTALQALVVEHPEPLWWHQQVLVLREDLTATAPDQRLEAVVEAGLLRSTLLIERTLTRIKDEADRADTTLSGAAVEMNRALSDCTSLRQLTGELAAYLPRLRVRRCFLLLAVDADGDGGGDGRSGHRGTGPARLRLVFDHRDGRVHDDLDEEPFPAAQLLPAPLRGQLDGGTLTVQPLSSDGKLIGMLLHEQVVLDRHTSEALRLDVSRALGTVLRAEQLRERADALEALVHQRTAELRREVAGRRAAQEELARANAQLRHDLLLDGLTKLHNRPALDAHLGREWARHERTRRPLSVLMCDVDHFKAYNDTYGHLAGDECLRRVAACLRAVVPRRQDVVARYGGEEFAIVLCDTDADDALLVATRLVRQVRAAALPHAGLGPDHVVTVSVGVATTGTASSLTALLGAADQALYTAKHEGRDRASAHVPTGADLLAERDGQPRR